MNIHLRAGAPIPTTVNAEARTVEAIIATGTDILRGSYSERLDLAAANLERLTNGPVLDGHQASTTGNQLGVVEAAEVRPEGLWVQLRFRSTEAAIKVLEDVSNGTLRGLSVGYTVERWEDEEGPQGAVRIARAWTPLEVSIVPVPADPGAHFRTGGSPVESITRASQNTEIRNIATVAGLTRAWADNLIDNAATVAEARAAAFTEMQRASAASPTRSQRVHIGIDHTDPRAIAERAGEALYARSHPEHSLSPQARAFAHMTTVDLARDCLRRSGGSTAMQSTDEIITRAMHTTSDFPLILGAAVGREVRLGYDSARSGAQMIARQTTARDFRPKRSVILDGASDLKEVPEGAPYKYGTIAEGGEAYAVKTFGRIFNLSRQVLVNDDISAFTDMPAKLGTEANRFIAAALTAKIVENPLLEDGKAVFPADHGNIAAFEATLGHAALSVARTAMRRQTGLAGEPIDMPPHYLLVPPELETTGDNLLTAINATSTDDANSFSDLELLVEPRLTNTGIWYLVADPAVADGLEYAFLEGATGPQVETQPGFETDGVSIKVRLDFGCGWIDHRSWYRSA